MNRNRQTRTPWQSVLSLSIMTILILVLTMPLLGCDDTLWGGIDPAADEAEYEAAQANDGNSALDCSHETLSWAYDHETHTGTCTACKKVTVEDEAHTLDDNGLCICGFDTSKHVFGNWSVKAEDENVLHVRSCQVEGCTVRESHGPSWGKWYPDATQGGERCDCDGVDCTMYLRRESTDDADPRVSASPNVSSSPSPGASPSASPNASPKPSPSSRPSASPSPSPSLRPTPNPSPTPAGPTCDHCGEAVASEEAHKLSCGDGSQHWSCDGRTHRECPNATCNGMTCDGNDHSICGSCGNYYCGDSGHYTLEPCGHIVCEGELNDGIHTWHPCGNHASCSLRPDGMNHDQVPGCLAGHFACEAPDCGCVCLCDHEQLECGHDLCPVQGVSAGHVLMACGNHYSCGGESPDFNAHTVLACGRHYDCDLGWEESPDDHQQCAFCQGCTGAGSHGDGVCNS